METGQKKVCNVCGELKSLDQFYKSDSCEMGVVGRCKECSNRISRDRRKIKKAGIKPIYNEDIKWCNSCRTFKPLSEFHKCSSESSGLSYKCKECVKKEYHKNKKLVVKVEVVVTEKVCLGCGKLKSIDEFHNNKQFKSGKHSRCKECVNADIRKNQRGRKFPRRTEGTKLCSGCGVHRPVGDFNSCPTHSDGLTSWCKECVRGIEYERTAEGFKVCSDCGLKLPVEDFYTNKKVKDGLTARCKKCTNKANEASSEKTIKNRNGYIQNMGTRVCTRCGIERDINEFGTNPHGKDGRQGWCKKCMCEYQMKKKEDDVQYKAALTLRNRVLSAVKREIKLGLHTKEKRKAGSAVDDLCCTIPELIAHLESQFYPNPETGEVMTWENHGRCGWHIDHIKPLAIFDLTDRKQFLEVCHYTNLQPLWYKENISKGAKVTGKEAA